MRSGLARKIGTLLIVPLCGAVVAVFLFWQFLAQTASAPAHINLSGRQRMLAVQLGDWTGMVLGGQDEDRSRLKELVGEYDRSLEMLEQGGELDGRNVVPLPDGPQVQLASLQATWDQLRPMLLVIADRPATSPEVALAARDYRPAIETLRHQADALTSAIDLRSSLLQRRMGLVFVGGICLNFALFLAGLWYARRTIVQPVLELDAAASRFAEGEFSVRVRCTTHDELCHLAETFNEMAERVDGLLQAIDLRRQHAEALADSLPVGTAILDAELRVVGANRMFHRMFDLAPGQADGQAIDQILVLTDLRERLLLAMGSDKPLRRVKRDFQTRSGLRPLRIAAAATRLAEEEARLILVVEDLTEEERLRAEADLRLAALDAAGVSVLITDQRGRIEYVNQEFSRLHGYTGDEVRGQTPSVVGGGAEPSVYRGMWQTITRGESWRGECINRRKDGSTYPADLVITPVQDQGGNITHFVGVQHDLTERKQLAAKMMEMDRMIAVGTLAAGVGHEINNPLSYVIANLDLLAEDLPPVLEGCRLHQQCVVPLGSSGPAAAFVSGRLEGLIELVDEARQGADRVRHIVRDLKTFSRADKQQRGLVDVRRLLDSSVNMAFNEIRHRARLVKDYEDVPPVDANEAGLGQVFINLLVNAAQAIVEGAADVNTIVVRTRCEGDQVIVEVEDTGSGIAKDHLPEIFAPFFTTKPIGQGTGLGLAIARQTVESHGGELSVRSQLGQGTVFRVSLPALAAVQPERASVEDKDQAALDSGSRRGRILVVDDEPMVGRVITRGLRADHNVVALTSAKEARERIVSGDRFDLVFCDLMMPEMTGMDLHDALLKDAPNQAARMVFLTGGAFTPRAREFLDAVDNPRIDKPFDMKNLRALARALLRQRDQGETHRT
ncbi:MAG: PAS domain S-box protein [Oligoflexia bacterium]|nr:PAS domain S-box protein [Oligoflexia bacterium]